MAKFIKSKRSYTKRKVERKRKTSKKFSRISGGKKFSKKNRKQKGGVEDGDQCAICLAPLNDESTITRLICKHMFHKNCISKVCEYERTPYRDCKCPMCRETISTDYVPAKVVNAPNRTPFDPNAMSRRTI